MSLIRRVTVPEGERFQESQINRLGAFDAKALKSATDIVAAVRERGDQAIKEFTKKFDGIDLDELKVPQEQLDSACDKVDPQFLAAIKKAAANIRGFHQRQLTQSWFTTGECGQITGAKVTPLARVGVYVPGGRAQYPSTVLMDVRSEERRVGKECRSRWSPYH